MCGGTHVKNTSEVLGVTVTKMKKVSVARTRGFEEFLLPILPPHRVRRTSEFPTPSHQPQANSTTTC